MFETAAALFSFHLSPLKGRGRIALAIRVRGSVEFGFKLKLMGCVILRCEPSSASLEG
jgi:hypothetical protein